MPNNDQQTADDQTETRQTECHISTRVCIDVRDLDAYIGEVARALLRKLQADDPRRPEGGLTLRLSTPARLPAAPKALHERQTADQTELALLRQAVSRDGLTGQAVIALAEAHRQDSEDMDGVLAELKDLRSSLASLAEEMRELAQRGEHAHGLTVIQWADRLALLSGEK